MRRALLLALVVGGACGDHLGPDRVATAEAPADDPRAQQVSLIEDSCIGRPGGPKVLVFAGENLWFHTGNVGAQRVMLGMCASHGFTVTVSKNRDVFTSAMLADTDVVVFSVTSGHVLDEVSRSVLEPWLRNGGGLVGLHTADATEPSWPYYVTAIGATLKAHAPGVQEAELTVEAPDHPIVAGMPARWRQTDEIHVFWERPETTEMTMLLAVDESTLPADYPAELKIGYHPIAWAHELYGGRVFFSCLGHALERYEDPVYVAMLARAIEWTASR